MSDTRIRLKALSKPWAANSAALAACACLSMAGEVRFVAAVVVVVVVVVAAAVVVVAVAAVRIAAGQIASRVAGMSMGLAGMVLGSF